MIEELYINEGVNAYRILTKGGINYIFDYYEDLGGVKIGLEEKCTSKISIGEITSCDIKLNDNCSISLIISKKSVEITSLLYSTKEAQNGQEYIDLYMGCVDLAKTFIKSITR
ncbi:MAG: hypothetical protein F7B61_05835 [Caldisphaeraceae archaeon]|nr:hypothetical protein [Caldisphaeraceae archaeon]